MTATTTTNAPTQSKDNPHRIPTLITGWGVPFVFIGALFGAGRDPEHAAWSGFAIVAIVVLYLVNKVRKAAYDRRAARATVAR
jgi:hypothetical protein